MKLQIIYFLVMLRVIGGAFVQSNASAANNEQAEQLFVRRVAPLFHETRRPGITLVAATPSATERRVTAAPGTNTRDKQRTWYPAEHSIKPPAQRPAHTMAEPIKTRPWSNDVDPWGEVARDYSRTHQTHADRAGLEELLATGTSRGAAAANGGATLPALLKAHSTSD